MTNFVFIVADDMRHDLLSVMPLTRSFGMEMPNAYVSNPTCGPSRVSMLTGDYSRTTQIYGNNPPYGGWQEWHMAGGEENTIATALAGAGYRCGLMGKYVNGYNPGDVAWVPPGWSDWHAITNAGGLYYDVEFSVNSVPYTLPSGTYLTDYLADNAWQFIQSAAASSQPFFLWLTPVSPHAEHVPAPRHQTAFPDLEPYRPPSFDVASTGASHFENMRPLSPEAIAHIDEVRADMMRTLLSLDELVARVVQSLSIAGVLDDTVLVFTSDNGYMLGEHRMVGKAVPHVEATHMPMVVRAPWRLEDQLISLVDLAPSMAKMAGIDFDCDGQPALVEPNKRDWLYIESGVNLGRPTFVQAQGETHSYTRYASGEEEFYDLVKDPYQLKSRTNADFPQLLDARVFLDYKLAIGSPPGWEDWQE